MTKETEVEAAPEPALVSSERPEDTEIVETVEVEAPAPEERQDIEDVIATQEDPRAEIYKRQREKREQEIEEQTGGFGEEDPETAGFTDENEQVAVESDEPADIIEPSPPSDTLIKDSDEMVTVKILGDFRQVPKSKVEAQGGVENYQIRVAAQEQMERNAHERQALEARKAALDEQERRMAAQAPAIPATDSQSGQTPARSTRTDGQNLEAMARRYQEAVYDDADEAPSILADMIATAAQTGQTFDSDALRRQVKEDVLKEQRQAKIVKASHALIDTHPELNAKDPKFDPRTFQAIDNETLVVEREHPEWEPEEVVQEAFDRIQKWKGGAPKPETMSEKQAEKRAMTRPRVGTQRYTPPPPPPRQTNADYVAAERKRRGLE